MNESSQSPRGKLAWSLLSVLIAAATVWAVVSQSRAFSLPSFAAYVADAKKPWLAAAACAMLGFIIFEGMALDAVCRAFRCPAGRRRSFLYAASDIYFSAITPSATGGQPACAWFMITDGVPGAVTTVVLLVNLTMYTAAVLVLGAAALLLRPGLFLDFSLLSRTLIVLGYGVQVLLAVFFLLLLTRSALLHAICRWGLGLLCRLRLVKREEEKRTRLAAYMEEYGQYARMIRSHRSGLAKSFLLNLLQRLSIISVSLFVYLARGGAPARAADVWAAQCYAVLGSNTVPIPGAMGVSDYLMLDGFRGLMPAQDVIHFELLTRCVSFYTCVILCGIVTLAGYLLRRKKK